MQSIIDAIEQWLKDFLIGAITGNLSSMFSDVNSKVATIATEVGKTPESWNSSVFSIILTLSKNVVVPIAGLVIAAVLTYELISMIIEKNNMHDIDTFMFFKWAFKSAAAAIIVNHTFDFIIAIFQVAQTMVQRSAGVIDTNASIDISSAIANITTELQATGLGDLFALMLETWVVSFAMKAMGLIITVILYGRMIEIYIYASVGPLPFATFMNREWGNIGTNYVRGLAALGLQGFLIMICVGIYAVLVNALSLGGDLQASIWSCAAYTVTLRNKGFGAVALENLDEEQKERYTATLSLKGNKPYLFGSDIYANESAGEDYDIPGEALADPDFAALIAEAEKYLGFPYVWGGSSPSTSFDCSGFVCYVYTHSGVHNLPRTTAQGIYNQCAHIPMSEAKPGDIIFFTGTYNSPGPVSHVGIYVGNNMMIHCGSPIQYARTDSSYWSQHFYAIGRLN